MTKERILKLEAIEFVWNMYNVQVNGNKKRPRNDESVTQKRSTNSSSSQRLDNGNSTTIDDENDNHAAAIAIFMEAYDPIPKNPRFKKRLEFEEKIKKNV